MMRAAWSVTPPGGKGTTILVTLGCAWAEPATAIATVAAKSKERHAGQSWYVISVS
jgi:hypothetical protein